MPALQTRTFIDKEVAPRGSGQSWAMSRDNKGVTEIEKKTRHEEPVVYFIQELTNSASNIGQLIVAKFYEKDASQATEREASDKNFHVIPLKKEPENEFDKVNSQRISLLAYKYEHERASREDLARLEILKARVRRLQPSVTVDDYEALAGISDEVDKIMKEDEELRKILKLE